MRALLIAALLLAGVQSRPVTEHKEPMRGKPYGIYQAPNKKATLLAISGEQGGDFPTQQLVLASGKHLYDLVAVRSFQQVHWSKDGKRVMFVANILAGYGKDDVCEVTYELGAKTVQIKVLRQVKDDPSG